MLRTRKHSDRNSISSGGCCANWSSPKLQESLVPPAPLVGKPFGGSDHIILIEEASQLTDPEDFERNHTIFKRKDF